MGLKCHAVLERKLSIIENHTGILMQRNDRTERKFV